MHLPGVWCVHLLCVLYTSVESGEDCAVVSLTSMDILGGGGEGGGGEGEGGGGEGERGRE